MWGSQKFLQFEKIWSFPGGWAHKDGKLLAELQVGSPVSGKATRSPQTPSWNNVESEQVGELVFCNDKFDQIWTYYNDKNNDIYHSYIKKMIVFCGWIL